MMESVEKVRPIAENIYAECKANGLTTKEFMMLIGLLTTKADEIQRDHKQKMLAEKLQ